MHQTAPVYTAEFKDYRLTTDKNALDIDFIHETLSNSHWAQGIPRSIVEKSIDNSLCFGLFHKGEKGSPQIGFARIISDYATFAYFCDVFVIEAHRGFGLSRWLVEQILQHPALQELRKYALYTSRAQDIYSRYGFHPVSDPENWMEIHDKDIYTRTRANEGQ